MALLTCKILSVVRFVDITVASRNGRRRKRSTYGPRPVRTVTEVRLMTGQDEPKPELRREGGSTLIDHVVIKLRLGVIARCAAVIVRAFGDYDEDVYLIRADRPDMKHDCKDIMSLMCMEGYFGTEVTIVVSGEDEAAEEIALQLYSGLTTTDSIPNLDRFMGGLR